MNIQEALFRYYGHKSFRDSQEEIINKVMDGKHVLAMMPTGSGKSVLYQLPAVLLDDLTIIISPLIALMKDQVDVLHKKKIDATFINSSLGRKEREKRYHNVEIGRYKMLYVTPERFRKKEFLNILRTRTISLLAVDEAHCISEWGHDFRPDYTRLGEFRTLMQNPPTLALTATATPQVREDILRQLGLQKEDVCIYQKGIDRPNLLLGVHPLWGEDEKREQIENLVQKYPGNGIVYFSLIRDLERMSDLLQTRGVKHLVYHGDLNSRERRQVQNTFMQGENNLVLATNAFGMGIDKANIRYVLHAQIPGSLEAYYQEIGRAGRDGKPSLCMLLYDEQDLNIHMEFIKWNNPSADFYHRAYHLLASETDRVNGEGLEFFKEQLTYKNRRDFRAETVLAMFDRWAVTEGDIEQKNLKVIAPLPERLADPEYLQKKINNEQHQLYQMMLYAKLQECRKAFIHHYFGLDHSGHCQACDNDISLPV